MRCAVDLRRNDTLIERYGALMNLESAESELEANKVAECVNLVLRKVRFFWRWEMLINHTHS